MNVTKSFGRMVLIVLAFAVSASQATAATPEGDPEGGVFPVAATASSGASVMSTASGLTVSCTSGTGTGTATSKTTGEGSYVLHGCKENVFGVQCTSPGQPNGTIKLATATAHLVYLDEKHIKPGVLATPPASGVFATFFCTGLIHVEVKGTGIMGEIAFPACGQTSNTATVITQMTEHGIQKYRQIEETGTIYNLTASINGGAFQSVGTTWTVTGTSEKQGTLTCP